MRILYVLPYAPSLIRSRPFHLIRTLAGSGHQVTVACLGGPGETGEELRRQLGGGVEVAMLKTPAWRPPLNCLRSVLTPVPLQAAFGWDPELSRLIVERLRTHSIDVVHIEHLRGSLNGLRAMWALSAGAGLMKAGREARVPFVWDSVDCITWLFEQTASKSSSLKGRWMAWAELAKTRRWEGRLVEEFNHTVVTAEADGKRLFELYQRAKRRQGPDSQVDSWDSRITVIGNGVDLEYFTPSQEPREKATLVFSGKMSYHANVTAADHLMRRIMPGIWKIRPDVRLVLAGKDPPGALVRLAESLSRELRGKSPEIPSGAPRIEVTGTVPDLRPYLRNATLTVVPLVYGAGIQNKILEAMACGTPVVTGAASVKALAALPGRDLEVADSIESFQQAVLRLLDDPERRTTLGKSGRAYVEENHNWSRIVARLEAVYRSVQDPLLQVGENRLSQEKGLRAS